MVIANRDHRDSFSLILKAYNEDAITLDDAYALTDTLERIHF